MKKYFREIFAEFHEWSHGLVSFFVRLKSNDSKPMNGILILTEDIISGVVCWPGQHWTQCWSVLNPGPVTVCCSTEWRDWRLFLLDYRHWSGYQAVPAPSLSTLKTICILCCLFLPGPGGVPGSVSLTGLLNSALLTVVERECWCDPPGWSLCTDCLL